MTTININNLIEPKWIQCKHCGVEWSEASYYIQDNRVDKCPECRGFLHKNKYSKEINIMTKTNDDNQKRDLLNVSNTLVCDECYKMCNELHEWNQFQKSIIDEKYFKKSDTVSYLCQECHGIRHQIKRNILRELKRQKYEEEQRKKADPKPETTTIKTKDWAANY